MDGEVQPTSAEKPLPPILQTAQSNSTTNEVAPAVPKDMNDSVLKELLVTNADFWGSGYLHLQCSGIENSLATSVEIDPAVKNMQVFNYTNSIDIEGDFVPETLYTVTVRNKEQSAVTLVTAPDHEKKMTFKTWGILFPLHNDFWNLPVSIENLAGKATVKVYKAYQEREIEFLKNPHDTNYSKLIKETEIQTNSIRNKEQEICLDLDKIGIPRLPGLYRIKMFDSKGSSWDTREQTLIVTDLGIFATYADDEVIVAVRSLKDCSPVANARVQIFSQKLLEYSHGDTDENGFCRLPLSNAIDKEDYMSYLIVTKGKDRVFANLQRSGRTKSLSKAAVYPERGVCRPGETMRIFATLRDNALHTQGGVPMEFQVTHSKGIVIAKDIVTGDPMGFYEYDCVIPSGAFTGAYSLTASTPAHDGDKEFAPYGSTHFLVGEYVPDQIKLSLEAGFDDKTALIDCMGKSEYYFGMPLMDASVMLSVYAASGNFAPKGFEDYSFGYIKPQFGGKIATASVNTLEDGSYTGTLDVGECAEYISTPVVYNITATTMPQAGGRAVSAQKQLTKDYAEYYVGAMKLEDSSDEKCVIRTIGVRPDGSVATLSDKGLKYSLKKYIWENVLKSNYSNCYERIWELNEKIVSEGKLLSEDGMISFGKEIGGGKFVLEISNDSDVILCDLHFWHWGGESGARLKDPNNLVFELDKENYLPGETALVSFESPMDGSGIVMPGLNHLAEPIAFTAKLGRNEISIPIPSDLNSGSWFAAVAVACRKDTASDPVILKGMISLNVRQDTHRLKVAIDTPEECKPSSDMEVSLKLTDTNGAPVSGEAILWGVDMGILSLTDYKTPEVFEFFFGKTNNPLTTGDNFKMLYPVLNAGTEKIGGGFAAAKLGKFHNEIQERLAAPAIFHLGIVKTDENGIANAKVRLPDYTGTLSVMAIAADSERTGSGAAKVVLRRETSLLLTVPRVVAPGDEFQITLQGFNHTLDKGDAQWTAVMEGDGSMECTSGDFLLDKGGSSAKTLRVKAGAREGRISFKFTMTLGGVEAFAEANVVVRHALPLTNAFDVIEIAPGESKEISVGEHGEIEIGTAALAVTGSLQWLASYPYGCLEQVTSKAMPMLAMQSLVDNGILPASYALAARNNILVALNELSMKRQWNGWMSMWNGMNSTWTEGSLFAYLFLFEAEKAGYSLDANWRTQIVANLKTFLNKTSNPVALRAFANYLLAYAEPQNAVKYLKLISDKPQQIPENADEKTRAKLLMNECDNFCKFLIAMTRIKCGHAAEGVKDLEKVLQEDFFRKAAYLIGFDSIIRREGMALWMLCDALPENPSVDKLYNALMSHRNSEGHWGTTQENAWAALGIGRYCTVRKIGKIAGCVTKGGTTTDFTAPLRYKGASSLVVKNTGDSAISAFVRDWKLPEKLEKVENGLSISKEFLDMDGNPITKFKRGQLLCVTLKVKFNADSIDNFVICDLLPGCLEIEDAQFATRSHEAATRIKIENRLNLEYHENRFDRFLGFGSMATASANTFEVSYNARVVNTGDFAIPPVTIESMYHPEIKAIAPYAQERMTAE
ncbi:MAG: MG2 domain-containing protein [Lentisphaeria bacterium]|nr:MG2 domain-containing protein [Lentisphaeria bacterium]